MGRKKLSTFESDSEVEYSVDAKHQNKNIRAPIGHQDGVNKLSEKEKVRLAIGKQARLDPSFYLTLPEYEDMQLFWWPESDIDSQIRIGARPVPVRQKSTEIFKGLNDKVSSEWEFAVVGEKENGNPERHYLMFMPADEYHKYKIQPNIDRNATIQASLGAGILNNDGRVMGHVKGLQTYAGKTGSEKSGLVVEQRHDA